MTYGWWMSQSPSSSIVVTVLPPGSVIEGDDEEETEDFTVPEGEVALMFQTRYVSKSRVTGAEHSSTSDMFFIHGSPQDIWNALGAAMQALPES